MSRVDYGERRVVILRAIVSGCCGASALMRSSAKGKVEVYRLLGSQHAVIVEDDNAFGNQHEVRRTFLG